MYPLCQVRVEFGELEGFTRLDDVHAILRRVGRGKE